MNCKDRIIKIASEEFPGSTVNFDDTVGKIIKFRIDDGSGAVLSKLFPYFLPSEIDDFSDQKLRAIIRTTCGF